MSQKLQIFAGALFFSKSDEKYNFPLRILLLSTFFLPAQGKAKCKIHRQIHNPIHYSLFSVVISWLGISCWTLLTAVTACQVGSGCFN